MKYFEFQMGNWTQDQLIVSQAHNLLEQIRIAPSVRELLSNKLDLNFLLKITMNIYR